MRFSLFVKALWLLCALCASVLHCLALDREAFSIPNYDLNLQLDPAQHRLGVRGKITLRNDTATPQKIAVLQISSSLDWRSIKAGEKAVQFVSQPYTSDIDHTGALSEAIVTLPEPVLPHASIELTIAYEGLITVDATRLTRIGTPEDLAKTTDWDVLDASFSGVRGAGYVAWYPIATEVANLSESGDLDTVLQRWKSRETESQMNVSFESTENSSILFSGTAMPFATTPNEGMVKIGAFTMNRPGMNTPTFVLADYKRIEAKGVGSIDFLPGREVFAASYAELLQSIDPLPDARGPRHLEVAELPSPGAAPFVSGSLLLISFRAVRPEDRLTLVYALARQKAASPRPWINEGLAHFAQVLDLEHERGRKAALDYLVAHRTLLADAEKQADSLIVPPTPKVSSATHSLINTSDELYLQSKAMWVWWMLHDMIGESALNTALREYIPSADKDASYMERLLEKPAQHDLQWLFDDWVYRDRGLPDFKVESAYSRKTMTNAFMLTVTVDNLGDAGAEVPIRVKFAGGEVTKRLEVRGKSKATIRIETPGVPQEITVNNGSIPESDMSNDTFKVDASEIK